MSFMAHVFRLVVLGAAFAAVSAPGIASAYPQWQFSSGSARCTQCHFSPAGGGLVTGYGRDKAGEELSTFEGNGAFLHGAVELPGWLALGADLRAAYMQHDPGDTLGAEKLLFPMQADVYARASFTDAISASVTAGVRGQARKSPGPVDAADYQPVPASRFVSREHYLMWRPATLGPYVRAGRFYAPYGLRLAEHNSYIRRDMGFNILEETYGLSGGAVNKEWEYHVTAFLPDYVQSTGQQKESGAAAMIEYRTGDSSAIGAQGRAGLGDGSGRYAVGGVGKLYVERIKTLFMGELNFVHRTFSAGSEGARTPVPTQQLVGFLGTTYFPYRGVMLNAFLEHSQSSIGVRDSAIDGVTGQVNWFPYPHIELLLLGRYQKPAGQNPAQTAMLQLHYYL